jgi:hypothetical protein
VTLYSDGCGGYWSDWNGDDDPQDPERPLPIPAGLLEQIDRKEQQRVKAKEESK